MVAKQQEIRDPGSKHPGNELNEYEDKLVIRNFVLAVVVVVALYLLISWLAAINVIR